MRHAGLGICDKGLNRVDHFEVNDHLAWREIMAHQNRDLKISPCMNTESETKSVTEENWRIEFPVPTKLRREKEQCN